MAKKPSKFRVSSRALSRLHTGCVQHNQLVEKRVKELDREWLENEAKKLARKWVEEEMVVTELICLTRQAYPDPTNPLGEPFANLIDPEILKSKSAARQVLEKTMNRPAESLGDDDFVEFSFAVLREAVRIWATELRDQVLKYDPATDTIGSNTLEILGA